MKLETGADARLIWTAYQDIRDHRGKEVPELRQVSPTEWELGIKHRGERRYAYRVTLDDQQLAKAAKFVAEKVAHPSEKPPVE